MVQRLRFVGIPCFWLLLLKSQLPPRSIIGRISKVVPLPKAASPNSCCTNDCQLGSQVVAAFIQPVCGGFANLQKELSKQTKNNVVLYYLFFILMQNKKNQKRQRHSKTTSKEKETSHITSLSVHHSTLSSPAVPYYYFFFFLNYYVISTTDVAAVLPNLFMLAFTANRSVNTTM